MLSRLKKKKKTSKASISLQNSRTSEIETRGASNSLTPQATPQAGSTAATNAKDTKASKSSKSNKTTNKAGKTEKSGKTSKPAKAKTVPNSPNSALSPSINTPSPRTNAIQTSSAAVSPAQSSQPRGHVPRGQNRSISLRAGYAPFRGKSIDYKVGDHVRLTDRRTGWIRYVGPRKVKSSNKNNTNDTWYGIELDEQFEGKHSGLVDGIKYFDTNRPQSGIFVRYNLLQGQQQEVKMLSLSTQSMRGHGRKLSSMIYRTDSAPHGFRDRQYSTSRGMGATAFLGGMGSAIGSPSNLMTPDTTTVLPSDSDVSYNLSTPPTGLAAPAGPKIRVSFVVPNYDHLLLADDNTYDDGYESDEAGGSTAITHSASMPGHASNLSLIDPNVASNAAQLLTQEEIAMRDKTVTLSMRDEDVDLMNDISLYNPATSAGAGKNGMGAINESETDENEESEDSDGSDGDDDASDASDDDSDESEASGEDGSDASEEAEDERLQQPKVSDVVRGSVVVKNVSGTVSDRVGAKKEKKEKKDKKVEKMAPLDVGAAGGGLFGLWDGAGAGGAGAGGGLMSSLVNDDSDLSSDEDDMHAGLTQAIGKMGSSQDEEGNDEKNGKKKKKKKKQKKKKSKKKKKNKKSKKKSKKKKKEPKLKMVVSDEDNHVVKQKGMMNEVDKILGAARDYGLMTEEEVRKARRRGKHEFKKISKKDARKIRKKNRIRNKGAVSAIRVQIPIGDLNSFCMRKVLSFLTIMDLAEWALCSKASRDCTRLVPKYDLRYLLRGYCSIQQTRKVLSVLSYHKPQELIFPLAYFIYDPVILRLFLTYFNVDIDPSHLSMNIRAIPNSPETEYDTSRPNSTRNGSKRRSTIDNAGVAAATGSSPQPSKGSKAPKSSTYRSSNLPSIEDDEDDGAMALIKRVRSDPMQEVIVESPTSPSSPDKSLSLAANGTNASQQQKNKSKQQEQRAQGPKLGNFGLQRSQQQMFRYIHRIVIDDRDIRPSTWVMRPGNYPWCELGKEDGNDKFPIELVDCFHSLGNRLWYVDVRHTENIELAYFAPSQHSVQVLAVNAQNRYDCEHFANLKELIIENPKITDDEIDRSDILDWKGAWNSLKTLHLVNQRFNCSKIDVFETVSWLPKLENIYIAGCRFHENENTINKDLVRENGNDANKVSTFKMKNQTLSVMFVDLLVTLFPRISKLTITECKVGKGLDWSFALNFRHLTRISIIDLKTKLRKKSSIESYNKYLQDIYDTISGKLTNSPIVIESNARGNPFTIASHVKCKYCGQLVARNFMDDHLSEMCLKRYIRCPLCRTQILRGQLSNHWEKRCINYRLICMLSGKTFATWERNEYVECLRNYALEMDKANGKYELIFANHPHALSLKNEYSVYLVANCRNCGHRVIQSAVSDRYIQSCIPDQCEVCDATMSHMYEQTKTMPKYLKQEISPSRKVLALNNAKKVLPHPFRRKSGSHQSQSSSSGGKMKIEHSKNASVKI